MKFFPTGHAGYLNSAVIGKHFTFYKHSERFEVKCEFMLKDNNLCQMARWLTRHGDRDRKMRISPFLAFCRKTWASVVEEVSATDDWTTGTHDACKAEIINRWRKLPSEKKER